MGARGATVLETVAVVTLTALILGLAVPLYRGHLADRALKNAAFLLQGDFRLAQNVAISAAGASPVVEVCFADDNSGYQIYTVDYVDQLARDDTDLTRGRTVKVATRGGNYDQGIAVAVEPSAVQVSLLGPATCNRALVLGSSGRPESFADASAKTITLSLRGRTYRVLIQPVTGRAAVEQGP